MSKQNRPALIVFGKRPRKHPRAAWFTAADAAVARWIAQQSGLSILKATARVINQLGNPVAEWQLSPRGQPMVPTVKSGTFEELQALASEAGTSEEGGVEASDDAAATVLSAFAPTGHTTRCRARLSGLQDAECDRRSAHVTKASRHRRHVLAHAGSDAQEISEFVVPPAIAPC